MGCDLLSLMQIVGELRLEPKPAIFDLRVAETLVFSHRELLAAIDQNLSYNGLRARGSADMLAVWIAKPRGDFPGHPRLPLSHPEAIW
jgi:hypothetical protein